MRKKALSAQKRAKKLVLASLAVFAFLAFVVVIAVKAAFESIPLTASSKEIPSLEHHIVHYVAIVAGVVVGAALVIGIGLGALFCNQLVAWRRYFDAQRLVRTGGVILLVGFVVMLGATFIPQGATPDPAQNVTTRAAAATVQSQRGRASRPLAGEGGLPTRLLR